MSGSPALETILVVDDDELVLGSIVAVLEHAGFHILPARSGKDAMKLAENKELKIDLLLSDVDMPMMSGPVLSAAVRKTRPDLRVILMSGGDQGLLVLNYGWSYLQKPFIGARLVQMVLSVLRSVNRTQRDDEFDRRKDKSPE